MVNMPSLSNVFVSGLTFIEWNLITGSVSAQSKMVLSLKPALASRSTSGPPPVIMTQIFSLALLINQDSTTTTPPTTSLPFTLLSSFSKTSFPKSVQSTKSSPSSSTTTTTLPQPSVSSLLYPKQRPRKGLRFKNVETATRLRRSAETLTALNGALFQYFDPIAFALGIMGNCLLCLVFLMTPLRARPLSHVLSGLGIIDLMYVISCLIIYLSSIGKPVYEAPGLCQVTMFTSMMSRSLQTWFMLVSHIDRLNAHFQSSFERRKRRVFNTKFVLIIMTMLALALSVHVLWSFETIQYAGKTYCLPIRDSVQYHLTIRKVHMICSVVIPLTIIAGVDLILLLKLALYLICKGDEDEDYDVIDRAGDYNCRQSGEESSFCTDKIVKFPLQEMKRDPCQHIITNCSPLKNHVKSHLSTIKEISSDNNSSTRTFSHGIRPREHHNLEVKTDLELIGIKDAKAKLHDTLSSVKKKEVARYILTLSEEYTEAKSACELTPYSSEVNQEKRSNGRDDWVKTRPQNELQIKRDTSEGNLSPGKRQNKLAVFRDKPLSNSYTLHSQSISHFRSCDFTSFASNVSRNTVIPEDHIFLDDIMPCTVVTFFSGIALAAFIIPSALTEGRHLFLSSPTNNIPSPTAIQLAIFFEFLVKFNSFYKLFLYIFMLGSFRQAFVWLFTERIPGKLSGTLKFRAVKSSANNDIICV